MANINCLGIDPGANGGLCFLSGQRLYDTPMPKTVEEMYCYLDDLRNDHGNFVTFIERVSHWVADTDSPGKKFGIAKLIKNYDQLTTMLLINNFPTVAVSPQTWQRTIIEMGYNPKTYKNKKNCWKHFAMERFNKILTLKTADAACIAWWGKQQVVGRPSWVLDNLQNKSTRSLFIKQ